ncbi:Griffithsin [Hondaea fermentalgiana]|uniref:Griffithsin n=1 Tax=Hondaea fermentalgiana TaxID=2315210 RepID=A0A2R5GN23_9STRA|nr:Griffithsin [Hondaea fermentalgiana]|eukprot:GBG32302.1 Griffithsin [Hondaea fermentalgiana]
MSTALGKAVRSCAQGDWAAAEQQLRRAAMGHEDQDADTLDHFHDIGENEEEEEADVFDNASISGDEDHGRLAVVRVRSGRHVDAIEFEFQDGFVKTYGNVSGGEKQEDFVLHIPEREYIVQIKGRQGSYLDGIQFVSNLGRTSRWYGGSGGKPFASTADAGTMIIGLDMADGFCPCLLKLRLHMAPAHPRKIGIFRLMLHPHARKLIFGHDEGQLSVFKQMRQGRPSLLWLLMRKRMLMFRLLLRGQPSLIRLMLDGEQNAEPASLMRRLCTPPPEGGLSIMQLMLSRDRSIRSSRSIAQLLLLGNPSVTRQFIGTKASPHTPLARMLFEGDQVNGYPSLTHLLTLRDSFDGVEYPSVLESALQFEDLQRNGNEAVNAPMSLLRLMLQGKPSIFDYMLEGEREGRVSILRRMVADRTGTGISISRMIMTSFENHKGHRPALSTYIFGSESGSQGSILRLMLAAERSSQRPSIMRLLFLKTQPRKRRRRLFRRKGSTKSSQTPHPGEDLEEIEEVLSDDTSDAGEAAEDFVDDDDEGEEEDEDDEDDSQGSREGDAGAAAVTAYFVKAAQRGELDPAPTHRELRRGKVPPRSLIDLLTAGTPSISDLFFEGELGGEDSLARLMLGTSVDFSSGYIRLGAALGAGNQDGVSLMQTLLAGEEDGSHGISIMRLLLLGEEDTGISVLRLLLTKESATDPSILRVLIVALKAILTTAKTRPSHVREHLSRLKTALLGGKGGGKSISEALNPVGSQIQALLNVLRIVRKRGKDFQAMWKQQFLRVAREIELSGQRAPEDSLWRRMAPRWKRVAESIAAQRWSRLPRDLAMTTVSLNSLQSWVSNVGNGLRKASEHLSSFDISKPQAKLVTEQRNQRA